VVVCLLAGCGQVEPAKTRYRNFVPPPVRQAQPATRSGEIEGELPVVGVPVTAPRVGAEGRPAMPPPPSNPQIRMQRADRLFAEGRRALQEGRPGDARSAFDQAIQVLMAEPLPDNPEERRRLEERLDDLADAIYHYDLEELGSGLDAELDALAEPVEKQLLEANLPVNPGLRERVQEQIERTMSELPLEVTDAVLSYISYFSTERGRRVLLSGYARAGRYRQMIERVFAEEGLPAELIFVAQLESHFNPVAVSYARAAGMWQFMRSSALEYNLRVNSVLDERRDPEQSTRAAARFLLNLYRHYGDWYLALAAYNCGPGCVDRAIQRTGYADFWELRRLRALPLATSNYVPEVLAMVIMYKNAEAYDLNVEHDPGLEYDNLLIEADTNLQLIAAAIDRPVGQIKQLNPALLQNLAPAGYRLHLPAGTGAVAKEALVAVPPQHRKTARLHRAGEEDSWAAIAKKYGTTVARLAAYNPSVDLDLPPLAGQFVVVPPAAAPAAGTKAVVAKKSSPVAPKKTAAAPKAAVRSKAKAAPKVGATAGAKTAKTAARAAGA
jgi:membrane-bound lytic murein transglycosylase D